MDRPTASDAPPDLSIILVNYNTAHLLDRLFAALAAGQGALTLQIIVVDNASRDGSAELIRTHYPAAELIANKVNVGFGRANNQAVPRVRGRYVLLLNTDAFVSPDTLPKTVAFMDAHPRCGVLGVKLVGSDRRLQPSCRYFPTPMNLFLNASGLARVFPAVRLVDDMQWDHASERDCDWVPGCFYLMRRDVVDDVGLFDPRYFMYYEEIDHCRAVRAAGWTVVYYPHSEVVHIGGESAASDGAVTRAGRQISALQIESELLYFRKHGGLFGLFADIVLALAADAINAVKGAARFDRARIATAGGHARTLLKLLGKTAFGSHPTR